VVSVISKEGDAPVKIFIAGGFADVTADNCTVLAEEAIMVSDLNQTDLEAEISKLDLKLANAKDDIERARYQNQLALNKAKMVAISS
jgi:F-type H+-transporting ATPase subunit epsilon